MNQCTLSAETEVEAVVVAVPARDEQERIVACLEGIREATYMLALRHPSCPVTVVVAADDCHDTTASLAMRLGADVVSLSAHCVGLARDAAIARGLAQLRCNPARTWVANTDADTVVPASWLCVQVELAAHACDVMVGTVEPTDEFGSGSLAAWHEQHRLEEGHPYVHGANLGFRASVWRQLGGFGAREVHEDVAFVQRAHSGNQTVIATDRVRAMTSGRRGNRVPGGFAHYLSTLPPAL